MVGQFYHLDTYKRSDYIGPITSYDFHFLSGAPHIRNNYFTLLRPFDQYVWSCFIASVTAVSISLIIINKIHNKISNQPIKEDPLQSRNSVADVELI